MISEGVMSLPSIRLARNTRSGLFTAALTWVKTWPMFISTTSTALAPAAFFPDQFRRERPERLQFEHPDLFPLVPPVLGQMDGRSGGRAVGNQDILRPLQAVFLVAGDGLDIVVDLIDQMAQQAADDLRVVGRKTPHVVEQAGDVIAMFAAEIGHRQPAILPGQIGMIIDILGNRGAQPVDDLQLTLLGEDQLFPHMADNLVEEQDNRGAIGLGHIEGIAPSS